MDRKIIWTEKASSDIEAIVRYIARRDPKAAARIGLADVAEFGLRWQDCEEFLRRLGYRAKVIVSSE